uniref:F-box family protein-like n=3 Tax=Oryza TaxID=4527 RepID=Q6K5M2_ORYSJ|nr:F-box family protein-like [Oryza sativa Japonica Group]BAD22103.1 F-box family protein-like [Oryza sativa Japonica Group]
MDRVLALDAAYPLPLLPVMLDKFPKVAATNGAAGRRATAMAGNGWTQEVEEEMRDILRVIRAKDENEYVSVGKLVLALNKRLAMAGPALAGAATLAAAFIGSGEVVASRRTSRRRLKEADVEQRENCKVFETKVALQLGRSTLELKKFKAIASPTVKDEDIKEFAGREGGLGGARVGAAAVVVVAVLHDAGEGSALDDVGEVDDEVVLAAAVRHHPPRASS